MTLSDKNVPAAQRVLAIESRVSDTARTALAPGLPPDWPSNAVLMFLPFAYADVPTGTRFDCCFPLSAPSEVVTTSAEIIAATQQFGLPFVDGIPHGWKTATIIGFEPEVPTIVTQLATGDSWYEHPPSPGLAAFSTWQELVSTEPPGA